MKSTPTEILRLEGVSKAFPLKKDFFGRVKKLLKAVNNVSLSIKRGETLGVIGESGCGKSTLGKIILDLEKPDRGKVYYKGKDISKLKGKDYREYRINVQAVFQNPQSSLNPRMRIWEIVTEGLRINFKLSKKDLKERALSLLGEVGLPPSYAESYPHQLSGGQKQRVAIARALALTPELIVADEPTSALDVSVQAQIVNLLMDIQEKKGISYFFISHSLPVVEAVSDRVLVMYKGYVVEEGKTEEVFKETAHPYTELLIESVPELFPKKEKRPFKALDSENEDVKEGCPFYPRCPQRRRECLFYDMKPLSLSETHRVSCILYL